MKFSHCRDVTFSISKSQCECQIFPINMKGSAGSLVTLVSWLGSWIVSYAFNFLMDWNSEGIINDTQFFFPFLSGVRHCTQSYTLRRIFQGHSSYFQAYVAQLFYLLQSLYRRQRGEHLKKYRPL